MIDTDKYEGHTPADEWRLVFSEGNRDKQILGLKVEAYRLGQMQACDYEDYLVAQANQDLARNAPLLLEEVKRWKKEHDTVRGWFLDIDNYMMEHHHDMWQEIRKEIGLDD